MTASISNTQGYVLSPEPKVARIATTQGYVLHKGPAQLAARQVAGYAVTTRPIPLATRRIAGYALANDPSPVVGKSGRDAIFDAIMAQTKKTRPKSHFNLSTQPEAFDLAADISYNTRIKLSAVVGSRLRGEMYFHYNRNALANIFKDTRIITVKGKTKTHDLIPLINAATGWILTTDDILNEDIPANAETATITAANTSYMFVPGSKVSLGSIPVEGPAWLLYDMETAKEVGTNVGVTLTHSGMTLDDTIIMDNRKSAKIPTNGWIDLALAQTFDANAPEWTVEYTIQPGMAVATYYAIFNMYAVAVGLYPGINHRTSDGGFGNRWQMGLDFRNQSTCYHPNFQQNTKVGVKTSVAFVKRAGVVTVFIDGKPQMLASGTTFNYNVAAVPFINHTAPYDKIIFGAKSGNGLPLNIGAVRISKFARYRTEYTVQPLLPPKAPALDSFIPVGKLDGFDKES